MKFLIDNLLFIIGIPAIVFSLFVYLLALINPKLMDNILEKTAKFFRIIGIILILAIILGIISMSLQ